MAAELDPKTQRQLAVDLFNLTWTFLGKEERTREGADAMIHAAHASAYHWRQIGTPANFARSEWQCSRVYAVLGRGEPSLHHARRCLELCEENPDALADWDLPFAHEALARAYAVAGDAAEAASHLERARAAAAQVADADDRDHLEHELASVPQS